MYTATNSTNEEININLLSAETSTTPSDLLNYLLTNYSSLVFLNNTTTAAADCLHYTTMYPDYASSDTSKYLFLILYSIVFVFGILGNVTMLFVTLSKRAMITVQNVFLMNLAVGDIVVCLLSVPITPIILIYKQWYFGLPLCHLIMWVQGSSIFISTLTLTAIALDRYMLIVYPHKQPTTIKTSLWIIAGIWAFSGVVTLPYAYFMRIVSYDGICGEFCDESWPSDAVRRAFTTIVFVCQFVVPFTIMSYCYATILHRLKKRIKHKLDRMNFRRTEKTALNKRKRRSTIVLACMVLIFGLTWLPQNAISMISNYVYQSIPSEYVYFAYLTAHCFAMLSILANPVLYAWLNSAFRKIILRSCANFRRTLFLRRGRGAGSSLTASTRTTAGYNPELCTDYLMRNYDSCRRRSTKCQNENNYDNNHLAPPSPNQKQPNFDDDGGPPPTICDDDCREFVVQPTVADMVSAGRKRKISPPEKTTNTVSSLRTTPAIAKDITPLLVDHRYGQQQRRQ